MDLSQYSRDELLELKQKIVDQLVIEKLSRVEKAREAIAGVLEEFGVTKEDVFNTPVAGRINYKHPKDPNKQWTGKGRKPAWFIKAIGEEGYGIEALEV